MLTQGVFILPFHFEVEALIGLSSLVCSPAHVLCIRLLVPLLQHLVEYGFLELKLLHDDLRLLLVAVGMLVHSPSRGKHILFLIISMASPAA
jgi:hypothetical protein